MRLKVGSTNEGPQDVLLVLIYPMTIPRLSWSCPWTTPRTYLSLLYQFLGRDGLLLRDPGSKMSWSLSRAHVCVCVCVSWSPVNGVQVVKHAIPIANSCPCWHPFHTLGLSSTTPRYSRGWQPRGRAQGGSNEPLYLGYWTPWPQLGGCSTT
jgi:hypothetical protein